MGFQEFINKWNTKAIDFDHAYGDQCMDLMHQYIVEVLGLTDGRILAAPVARNVFENFTTIFGNQYFDRIFNAATNMPQDGDIVFWKDPYGYYFNSNTKRYEYAGHVGISKGSNVNNIIAFEQNNPPGSKCHIQIHTDLYKGVLGWLHPKNVFTPATDAQKLQKVHDIAFGAGSGDEKIDRIKALF